MRKNEKVTQQKSQKSNKSFNGKKDIEVIGNVVSVDRNFDAKKIKLFVDNLIEAYEYGASRHKDFDKKSVCAVLLLKYFTNVDIPDGFEKKIADLESVLKVEVVQPILDAFEKKQMDKINDAIEKKMHQIEGE